MTEHTDETHEWPLRDRSNLLRPPAGTEARYSEDDDPVIELSETEAQLVPETDVEEPEADAEEPEADAEEPAPAHGAAPDPPRCGTR